MSWAFIIVGGALLALFLIWNPEINPNTRLSGRDPKRRASRVRGYSLGPAPCVDWRNAQAAARPESPVIREARARARLYPDDFQSRRIHRRPFNQEMDT